MFTAQDVEEQASIRLGTTQGHQSQVVLVNVCWQIVVQNQYCICSCQQKEHSLQAEQRNASDSIMATP